MDSKWIYYSERSRYDKNYNFSLLGLCVFCVCFVCVFLCILCVFCASISFCDVMSHKLKVMFNLSVTQQLHNVGEFIELCSMYNQHYHTTGYVRIHSNCDMDERNTSVLKGMQITNSNVQVKMTLF